MEKEESPELSISLQMTDFQQGFQDSSKEQSLQQVAFHM